MDLATIFLSVFLLVFIGELGDKTQIAAGTGTLANRKKVGVIFLSSVLALVAVSGLTTFGAGLIPEEIIPLVKRIGGVLLVLYGIYLFKIANEPVEMEAEADEKSSWALFFSHLAVVFTAELGDKTQIATLSAAVENQSHLLVVFAASSLALISVTTITVWGVTKVPIRWIGTVQRLGATLMIGYGIYMFW